MAMIDRLAANAIRGQMVPGVAIAVVHGDEVVATDAAGLADLATRTSMTVDGACNWFSMTKIATATAVMILAESGSLDIEAPVGKYLGEVWPASLDKVSVRHLLSHSGGLRNPIPIRWVHRPSAPRPDPCAFLARLLSKQGRTRFEPGSQASYSNIGYLALGEVIAAVAACPYETFVHDHLLVPLQMTHTAFTWNDPALTAIPRISAHHRLPRALTPLVAAVLPAEVLGARSGKFVSLNTFELDGAAYGGLIGPVTDAARLVALFASRGTVGGTLILRPHTIDSMTAVTTRGHPYDVGMGWFRPHNDPTDGVEHFGGGVGYWNVLRLRPRTSWGAAVMSNTTHRWDVTAFADAAIDAVERDPR
jgi:CubicO group peptidase (beta-lactamase class C family)